MVEIIVQVGSGVEWKALLETRLMFLSWIPMCGCEEDLPRFSHMIQTNSLLTSQFLRNSACLIKDPIKGENFSFEKVDD